MYLVFIYVHIYICTVEKFRRFWFWLKKFWSLLQQQIHIENQRETRGQRHTGKKPYKPKRPQASANPTHFLAREGPGPA